MVRFSATPSRPEPDHPAGPDEPIDISEPAGPPNRPKPDSENNGPFPTTEPLER
jgi:hypothetical protein